MKDFFIFALLACIVYAEPGWNPASTYVYQIQSQSLASIDERSNVYQGVNMKGALHLQTGLPQPWTLTGKIIDLQYAEFHAKPVSECLPPLDNMTWKSINISNNTFAIMLNNGIVEKIMINNNISTWEANYIRSLVTHLQISFQDKKGETTNSHINYKSDILQFSRMEDTILGRCEMIYDISPLSENVIKSKPELAPLFNIDNRNELLLDIDKTHNFSNCERHIVYHKGMNGKQNWDAGFSNIGHAIKRTAKTRIIINGTFDNYTMQSSVAVDKMQVSPSLYKNDQAILEHCMNLTLKGILESAKPPSSFNGTESNLLYDYEYKTIKNIDVSSMSNNKIPENQDHQQRRTRQVQFQKSSLPKNGVLGREKRSAGTPRPDLIIITTTDSHNDSTTDSPNVMTASTEFPVTSTIPTPPVNTFTPPSTSAADPTNNTSPIAEDITSTPPTNITLSPFTVTPTTDNINSDNVTAEITPTSHSFTEVIPRVDQSSESIPAPDPSSEINPTTDSSTEFTPTPNSPTETIPTADPSADIMLTTEYLPETSTVSRNTESEVKWNVTKELQQPKLTSLFTIYPSLKNTSSLNRNELQNAIKVISERIGSQLLNFQSIINKNVLYAFNELTSLIANADYETLYNASNMIHESLNSNNTKSQMSWIVFRDAVAQSGTGPALMLIKSWILTNITTNNEAEEVLGILPTSVDVPNEEYVDALFNLMKHPRISMHETLNVTALLSFSKIVCNVFVDMQAKNANYPVHVFSPLVQNMSKLEVTYIPYFKNKLNSAVLNNDRKKVYAYVRALGNIAHPEVLNIFSKHTNKKGNATSFTRQWMIMCLDKIVELYPTETRSFLYPLYIDINQPTEVRTAAVFQIMKTKPPLNMLQKIAELSKYDNSNQVIAAVQSSFESASILTNPEDAEFKENSKTAKSLLNTKNLGIQYSHLLFKNQKFPQFGNLGFNGNINYFGSNNHIIPNGLFMEYEKYLGGLTSGKEYNGILVSDMKKVHKIFENLWDIINMNDDSETLITENKQVDKKSSNTTDHKSTEDRLKAIFLYQLAKYEKLLMLDLDDEGISRSVKQILKTMKTGYKLNHIKLFNRDTFILAMPNLAGHVSQITYKVPSIFQITGNMKLNLKEAYNSNSEKRNADNFLLSGRLNIGHAFNKYTDIGFVTPFNGRRYISGYKEQLLFNIPLSTNFSTLSRGPWSETQITFSPYNSSSVIYFQFNSQRYQQNDYVFDIVKRKNIQLQNIIQNQPSEQIIQKLGSLELNIDTESRKEDNVFTEENDFFSILNFPGSHNYLQNYNFTFKVGFPPEIKSVSLRSRNANMEIEEPVVKGTNKQRKHTISPENSLKGNKTSITEWSVLFNQLNKPAFTTTLRYSSSLFSNNTNLQISLTQASEEIMKWTINGSWTNPTVFNTSEELYVTPQSEINGALFLLSSNFPSAQIKCKLERTPERQQYLMNTTETKHCLEQMRHGDYILPSCQVTSIRASYLDQHNCSISIEGLNEKNTVIKNIFKFLHNQFFDSFTFNKRKVCGPQNIIGLKAKFNPSFETADVFISLPNTNANVKNISIPTSIQPIVMIHPSHSVVARLAEALLPRQYNPTCVIDKNNVNTYDNKTYPVRFGACWHVAMALSLEHSAKRVLGENDILILTRDSNERRVIRILIDKNTIDVINHPSNIYSSNKYIYVNKEYHQILQENFTSIAFNSKNNIDMQVMAIDEKVKLDLANQSVQILFDGVRLMITTKNSYRNQTLGLCGTFNGEDNDDFALPNTRCRIQDSSLFTASYAVVSNNTCSGETLEVAKKAINMTCSATKGLQVDAQFPEAGPHLPCGKDMKPEHDPRCVTSFTHVIRNDTKTCFSKKKIPKCKSSCHPIKITQKQISFHCVASKSLSEQLVKDLQVRRSHDFSRKSTSTVMAMDIPSGCFKC